MRFYEDVRKIADNRLPQRSYYIPKNEGEIIEIKTAFRTVKISNTLSKNVMVLL